MLFAVQAANAVANARVHCDEQRARADLEALVETSPVGVAVFDAATGHPVSFNREARRLAGRLSAPGSSPEQLLDALTCRFSDGREVALADFPVKRVIGDAETVRAEEVVLSAPDGRNVTLLVNATPIRAADDIAVSMVVTLQDLAPLQELERLRAEFLGMVSHELRAPLTSIKGSTATVLRASRVLDPAEVRQFFRIIDSQADHMDGLIGDLLDAGRIDSGTLSVDPEPAEVGALLDRARTTFVSGGGRQSVRIDLSPDLPLRLSRSFVPGSPGRPDCRVLGLPAHRRGRARPPWAPSLRWPYRPLRFLRGRPPSPRLRLPLACRSLLSSSCFPLECGACRVRHCPSPVSLIRVGWRRPAVGPSGLLARGVQARHVHVGSHVLLDRVEAPGDTLEAQRDP